MNEKTAKEQQSRSDVLSRRQAISAPPQPHRYATLKRIVEDESHRLVVSFGGGGVPGLCGNVALAVILEELDLKRHVREVWGTSAGAIVGGGWASGAPAPEILKIVQTMDRRGVLDVCWTRLLWSILLRPFGRELPDGLVRGRHFLRAIDSGLRVKTFEECPVPFRCIASTDDGAVRPKVFKRGPLLPAIFSSMSLPGIISPPRWAEEERYTYYDGGIVEKTPLLSPIAEHARLGDLRKLLILGTHFTNQHLQVQPRGFIRRFVNSIYRLEEMTWRYQVGEARSRPDVVLLLLDPGITEGSVLDFSVVESAYLEARESLLENLQNHRVAVLLGRK